MLHLPPLYPIADAGHSGSLAEQVRCFGEAGYPLVQFRGKSLEPKAQWQELRTCLQEAAANGGWPLVVVNDRADLAVLAAREGLAPWGLHLGQEDLPPSRARALPGLGALHLGTSTRAPHEWAAPDPVCDHAGVGPFRATASKGDHAPPIGLGGVREGCAALRFQGVAPIVIGGLRMADAGVCYEAGAESMAMIGELARAPHPGELLWQAQTQRWRARTPFRLGQGMVLVGGSGSGKSSLGKALAPLLGLPLRSSDEAVEIRAGRPIRDIFAHLGETAFRVLEREVVGELLEGGPCLLDLGGGAWEDLLLQKAITGSGFAVLWVAEPPLCAWKRVSGDPARPLAQDRALFLERHRRRMPLWAGLPMVLGLGRKPEEIAMALVGMRV